MSPEQIEGNIKFGAGMNQKYKVAILGDGGWGTALGLLSQRRGNETLIYSSFPEYAKVLDETRENKKFLPGYPIPREIRITSDINQAVEFGDIIILAVPSLYLRNFLFKLKEHILADKTLVSVTKGIEARTLALPSEIIYSVLGEKIHLGVLSGPSHAEEVAGRIPTLVVVGSKQERVTSVVQQALRSPDFRVYMQSDVIGIEIGGALKNVIAIGAGICDGLAFGSNTKAALVTRGLLEMARLGIRMGANPNTFFGLSGLGDLITTCVSPFGRNLKVGQELGKGRKLKEILASMEMVAEGVETTRSAFELVKKYNVNAPITEEIYKILYEDKDPKRAIVDLMMREAREEMKQY